VAVDYREATRRTFAEWLGVEPCSLARRMSGREEAASC
jgi:hypothetical protein